MPRLMHSSLAKPKVGVCLGSTVGLRDHGLACRFEEAERLCRNAIMILEKSVGEEDVNVAAALSLQATCLQ